MNTTAMKRKSLILLVLLMDSVCAMAGTKMAYYVVYKVVKDSGEGMSSFHHYAKCFYDDQKDARMNEEYFLFWRSLKDIPYDGANGPGFTKCQYGEEYRDNIGTVIFDPSFAELRLKHGEHFFHGLENATFEGLEYFNTSELINAESMFYECQKLTTFDLSGFDMRKVTSTAEMFSYCTNLTSLTLPQFSDKLTDTSRMFYNCRKLTTINGVERMNTRNVTDMHNMFSCCNKLTTLDVSNFDTGNVTTMRQMFEACEMLTTLDVSNFDTSNVTDMSGMFNQCNALESLDLSLWDTGNVTDMHLMFYNCHSLLDLDVCGFNTENVENMSETFRNLFKIKTLNLKTWNTSKVTNMKEMFRACSVMTTIYVSDLWSMQSVEDSENMFSQSPSLKGGSGTTYNNNWTNDGTYAHIDGGTGYPGYLTERSINSYSLWVGGVSVTEANKNNIPGLQEGKATCKTVIIDGIYYKMLTLNNAKINYSGIGIRSSSNLIIVVRGKNTIETKSNPISFDLVNNVVQDYDDSGENELVMTGSFPITFYGHLDFRNRFTLLNTNGAVIEGKPIWGVDKYYSPTLTFGGGTTFCGIGDENTNGVVTVEELIVESGSQLLGSDQNQTVSFDATQQTVLQNGTPMKGGLYVGQYFPLWLGNAQLSTALVPALNQVYSQYVGDAFNLDVRSIYNGIFETVEMKARIPGYCGLALRSEAPFLTIELTGNCAFETNVTDKPAMQLSGYTTVKGTGKLTVKSEKGVGITNSGNALLINDVDIDIYGAKGGVKNVLSLFPTSVEGTISSGNGYYCVSETNNFVLSDCYILNNVSFNSSQKRINSTVLEIGREKKTIATDISEPVTQPTTQDQPMYNVAGQRVGKDYKGIVIQNGKKTVVK